MRRAITGDTVMLVGSAPSYTHGVVDPIPQLAEVAAEHRLHFHVDACVGGFFLPFLEKLGEPVPRWDFRVPGVHTISADLHKHGYAGRGASMLLQKSEGFFIMLSGWATLVCTGHSCAARSPFSIWKGISW